jgi:uncharacterized protein YkwD
MPQNGVRARLLTAAVALFAAGCVTVPASAGATLRCPPGQTAPAETLCWLNAARSDRGLAPLRSDPRLARAAEAHSRDMVTHRYFEHTSPDGVSLSRRIAATGWMRGRRTWRVGETLAWGSGSLSEPEAIVQTWLDSPPHRRIVLSPSFRLVGIGSAPGVPVDGVSDGVTYTSDFGSS